MQLSLFSVSYAGLWGQQRLDLLQFIAKGAELGYAGVMLMGKRPHLSPLDVNSTRIDELKQVLQQHRIACVAVAGYTDFAATMPIEVPFLEMQIAYLESLARIAAKLEARFVRVFTAYEREDQNPHSLWQTTVTCLQEACSRVSDLGVTLAIQNHHDIAVHSDALLELLADVDRPNCKLSFDAWSPALRGEELYETVRRMAPHTVMTTNADYVRFPRYRLDPTRLNYEHDRPDLVRAVRFGDGFIDYEAFFQGLRDGGFNGIANYEICSPIRGGGSIENLDQSAAQYLRWMRERGYSDS